MELPTGRDTLLHFFEQLQKQYPTMQNFYSRQRGEYILEEGQRLGLLSLGKPLMPNELVPATSILIQLNCPTNNIDLYWNRFRIPCQ